MLKKNVLYEWIYLLPLRYNIAKSSCFPFLLLLRQQIKTDMVLVMCKKQTSKNWDCLTKVEKQTKEKKE